MYVRDYSKLAQEVKEIMNIGFLNTFMWNTDSFLMR